MDKDAIREEMRERRRQIAPEERRELARAASKKVLDPPIRMLLRAWRVCLYLSTKNEIPTRYIARAVWEQGREVCVPAWSRSEERYKLSIITPKTQFIKGHHGIREPLVRLPINPWDVDAFVLPGLAFDTCGGRLGFGAGHYDRILDKAVRTAVKIALCYDWQVVDETLPQEPHDIPVDWIVTDKRVIHCAENRKGSVSEHSPLRAAAPLTSPLVTSDVSG